MPFFSKAPEVFIDRSRGDAQAAQLIQAATAGEWRSVEAALTATTDPLRREFLIDGLASDTQDLRWVDQWVRDRAELQTARVVWGACAVQYAFHIRSGDVPENVSAQQWQGFHEWLTHADEQLRHAVAMDPTDAAPWVSMLWSAVGLEVPFDEAERRWDGARRLHPHTELGALAYTTYISPRWHGSEEMLWRFVKGLVSNEPEGSPRWTMVPTAHFEQWAADRMSGNARVHESRYFQQPHVQSEINEAYSHYLGSAERKASPLEPQYRGTFAVAFYLMGAREALRREMEVIGPGIQRLPWGYLGGAGRTYKLVRESAGLR